MVVSAEQKINYLHRRQDELSRLWEYLFNKNFLEISSIAHKLKGNGATFGYEQISLIGQRIEISAQNQSKEDLEKLLEQYQVLLRGLLLSK